MLVTAESVVAEFVAIDKEFNEERVILAGMEDNYTECMSSVREYVIHGSYHLGISKRRGVTNMRLTVSQIHVSIISISWQITV